MADEVKHMPGSTAQHALQVAPRLARQPMQFNQAILLQPRQGALYPLLFLFDIQTKQVAGTGDHAQHAQWRLNQQGLGRLRQLEIAHNRRVGRQADEFPPPGIP